MLPQRLRFVEGKRRALAESGIVAFVDDP